MRWRLTKLTWDLLMAKNEQKEASSEGSDLRYRYIGYEVFPSKVKEFFKSDAEKKHYEEQVEEYTKTHNSSMRSGTAVSANLLGTTDRIVLTLTSIGLIAGAILPWFSVSSIYGNLKIPGLTGFSAISHLSGLIAQASGALPTLVYVFSGLALLSLFFGIATLIMLYLPSKDKSAALARLKHILGWQYLPLTIWAGVFIYLIIGVSIPFGEEISNIYMIKGLGSKFNIVTFWAFAQPALWVAFCSLVINAVKSNEL